MAAHEAVRRPRHQRAVDLALRQHVGERLVLDAGELHALRDRQLDLLGAAGLVEAGLVPVHVLELDAALVAEPAAHIDRGGVRPFRRADLLALEVLGALDLALLVDEERREPEVPRGDHRQRQDVGVLARHLRGEFRERQFADVPFAVGGEAREDLVQLRHQPGVLDAFGADIAGAEIAEVVVVLGGDGEVQLFHVLCISWGDELGADGSLSPCGRGLG